MTRAKPLWWLVGLIAILVIFMDGERKASAFERAQADNRAWSHCIRHDAPWDCPR